MPSMRTSDVNEPADVTPTQAEQLQAEIEEILPDITAIMQEAKAAEENAETSAENAATSAVSAEAAAKEAKKYANDSETNLSGALGSAKRAETAAESAENSANEAKETGEKAADELQKMIDIFKLTGNGNGVPVISVHDELYKEIVPEDGQVYVVKYHDMPYGEDPSLISDKIFYRLRIGDGVTPLCDIPNFSNIVAGTGNGSAILVDPTYDNGDDGLEAPNNIAAAQYAVALGKYLKNYGKASAVFGYSNENHAARAFVAGMSNLVTEEAVRAFVTGYKNTVKGLGAAVLGGYNTVEAQSGKVIGASNTLLANAISTILMGRYLTSDTAEQIVLGKYNETDPDASLIIGCGTSKADRKNAFVVKNDGTVLIGGEEYSPEATEELLRAYAESFLTETEMYLNESGELTLKPADGELKLVEHLKFLKNGHSDVAGGDMNQYTEYPTDDSESDRAWAYLGNTSKSSYSNGFFANVGGSYAQIAMSPKDTWTAFKLKGSNLKEGICSVLIDYVAVPTQNAVIEVYMLPMTDEMQEEFAPDNIETYGTTASADDGTARLVRVEPFKLFPELTSIAGAEPIGKFCITSESDGAITIEDKAFDMKLGTINVTEENADKEWLILFRNDCSAATATLRLKSLGFTKFEPRTDAIKVGDTVLTEEELLAIKASAGTSDLSGFATKEELTAEIGGAIEELTAEDIGAAPSGHTHTASEVGASPSGHTHTAADVGAATEKFVTSAIEEAIGSAIGGSY